MANRSQRVSDEMQDKIVSLYEQGMSRRQIGFEVGSALETVTKVLTDRGIPLRPHFTRKIVPNEYPIIAQRYLAGEQIKSIAEDYGVVVLIIRRILDRQDIVRRDDRGRKREYTPDEIDTIRRMTTDGASQSQIAHALGSAQTTVSKLMRQAGIPPARTGAATREQHYKWAGGRTKHPSGYWQIRLDPSDPMFGMSTRGGYVMEHRLVMAKMIGRPLLRTESVHHIDGNRLNNAPENLQLRQGEHGKGVVHRCLDCGSSNIEAIKIAEVH